MQDNFPNKIFLIIVSKNNSLYLLEKTKAPHFRCLLNTAMLFLSFAKLSQKLKQQHTSLYSEWL